MNNCENCGAPLENNVCIYCGSKFKRKIIFDKEEKRIIFDKEENYLTSGSF